MLRKQHNKFARFLVGFFFQSLPGAMLVPMLTLGLAARGVEATLIGALAVVGSVAYMVALFTAPSLIKYLGAGRAFRLAQGSSALAGVSLVFADAPALWVGLYATLSFAGGLRFTIAESWVPSLVAPKARGRALALFQTSLGAAIFVGSGVLLLIGIDGPVPQAMVVGATLVGLALLWPMAVPAAQEECTTAARGPGTLAPPPRHPARQGWQAMGQQLLALGAQVGPLVLGAAILGGLFESGLAVALPLFGLNIGFSPGLAAGLLTAMGLGSLAQYPFGALVDRYPWHRVMLGTVLVIAVSALVLPLAQAWPWLLMVLGVVWGSAGGGLYTLVTIRNGSLWRGSQLVGASVVTQVAYMVGEATGPALGGIALDSSPQYGLPVLVAIAGLVGLVVIVGAEQGQRALGTAPSS